MSQLDYKDWGNTGGTASEALTANTAVAVDFTAANQAVSYVGTNGDLSTGIIVANAASGEDIRVIVQGIVPVKIGTASGVAVGDLLTATTTGTMIEATTGNVAIAQALQVPSADGDIIKVRLISPITV